MIDGHGDDLYRYGDRIRHNFSSNIFQAVDHTDLKRHLADRLDVISNYPEPAPYSVESLLAERLGLPDDCVMVTNGAADAIHIIARHTAQDTKCVSAVLQPTFAEYADACRISGHVVVSFADIDSVPEDATSIWICNPNNPTGIVHDPQRLMSMADSDRERLVVIDQAYHKYTRRAVVSPVEVLNHPNLVLLYSLTKDYAIPGLRLGYVVADKRVIDALRAYRTPWSVNAVAIEAAKYLLVNDDRMMDTGKTPALLDQGLYTGWKPVLLDRLLEEVDRVGRALEDMGIMVSRTETNFMLCQLPVGTAAELKEYLAREHGILIRDASNFVGLTPAHFRIAVQSPQSNDILIRALRLWLSTITNYELLTTYYDGLSGFVDWVGA